MQSGEASTSEQRTAERRATQRLSWSDTLGDILTFQQNAGLLFGADPSHVSLSLPLAWPPCLGLAGPSASSFTKVAEARTGAGGGEVRVLGFGDRAVLWRERTGREAPAELHGSCTSHEPRTLGLAPWLPCTKTSIPHPKAQGRAGSSSNPVALPGLCWERPHSAGILLPLETSR